MWFRRTPTTRTTQQGSRRRPGPTRTPGFRPALEPLEDRRLLAAGALDPTFNNGGGTVLGFSGSADATAAALAVQPDGKLVVAGTAANGAGSDFALARYNANGSLDTSFGPGFGTAGTVTAHVGLSFDHAAAVALQADGKILVAGSAADGSGQNNHSDFALARFTPDGRLDATFGNGGTVVTDFASQFDTASGVAVQPDGKIVVVGSSQQLSVFTSTFAVARYNADGSLDTSFAGGQINFSIGLSGNSGMVLFAGGRAVTLQGDGKILVAGVAYTDFALVRLTPAGVLDSTFGTGGSVTTHFIDAGEADAVAVQADGRIVVAGSCSFPPAFFGAPPAGEFGLARFTSAGQVDSSFGTAGQVTGPLVGGPEPGFKAVAVQADGKIVAAGTLPGGFAVNRFNADGSPDATFGSAGQAVTAFAAGATAHALALTAGGNVVVAGAANGDLALARYTPAGNLDASFSGVGEVTTNFVERLAVVNPRPTLTGDGKLVVAGTLFNGVTGDFVLARLGPDGTLDATFGNGGEVITDLGGDDRTGAVAIAPDGGVFVAGSSGNSLALVRYTAAGSLDPSFGLRGKVLTTFGPDNDPAAFSAAAVLVQADGKIVVVGTTMYSVTISNHAPPGSFQRFALARYTADGRLDPTFGSGGLVFTALHPSGTTAPHPAQAAAAAVLQPDGKILVAGTDDPNATQDFALARYNPDGSPDATFGAGQPVAGEVTTDIMNPVSGDDRVTGLALQPGGRIVAAGITQEQSGGTGAFAMARYNPDGSLDTGFGPIGPGGVVTDNPGSNGEAAGGVGVLPNGSLVVAGSSAGDFAVTVYDATGRRDANFGTNGQVTTDFFGGTDAATGLVVQPDGKIVAVGLTSGGTIGPSLAVARYQGFPPTAAPPRVFEAAGAFAHSREHYFNFVVGAYQQYLKRTPDAAGRDFFIGNMQAGVYSDEQVEAFFIGSQEYIANHGGTGRAWVIGMYQDLLGRTPSEAEVQGWLTALANGTPSTAVALGFAASPEREAQRVRFDYQTYLGRAPSQDEVNLWVNGFLQGLTNESLVAGFVGSPEYYYSAQKGQGSKPNWVTRAYLDVLFRAPSPDEVNGWLQFLG